MENEKENEIEIIEPVERPVDLRSLEVPEELITPVVEHSSELFYYTIVAPKGIRSNTNYTLNMTIHDAKCEFNEPVIMRVAIEDEEHEDGINIHQDVTIKPNVTEIISMPVGDLNVDSDYKLVVKGISGITLEREASLDLQTQTHTILIQTDKAIYKPNDCVKFRVLVLDCHLKAATIEQNELIIAFNDPCRNLMKKWNGVNTSNGVFSGEFQLSDLPNLGEWRITAAVGDQTKIAIIEVAEYVLPKFEALIESPDHFTLNDGKVRIIVRAKYTHGKSLRGSATVSVTEEDNFGIFRYRRESQVNKPEDSSLVQRTFNIDGEETVEFDIEKELKYDRSESNQYFDVKNFKIKADVIESLTGLSQSAEKTIKIHKNTYNISTDLTSYDLKRDSTADVNVSVRKQDNSLVTFLDPNKKKITIIRERFFADVDEANVTETIYDLDENGDVFFTLEIGKNESSFALKAKYGDQETDLGRFYTVQHTVADKISLKAKVLTGNISINKDIEVEVMSHYPFPTYTYLIVARGKILETKTITPIFDDSESSEYVHKFSFHATFDNAPRTHIIVYYVRDASIVSTKVNVEFFDDFKNFIDLNVVPNAVKPGQMIDINIKSNPNSFIGLHGIDKSVLILRSGNDLSKDEIWNELDLFHSEVKRRSFCLDEKRTRKAPFYNNEWEDFQHADLITFSNTVEPIRVRCCYKMMACDMMVRSSCFSEAEGVIVPRIRKDFPETWIWESITDKSTNGMINLKKKVPDSLTTWVLTGFSIDPINGLAITKSPLELCVQQKFHISLNLPYSVKRGEVVTIPCSIFNYSPDEVETEVVFENEHNNFEFVDQSVDNKIYPEISKQNFRKKKLTIRPDDALNALFTIRPTKIGLISLRITATSKTASDCIIKTLNVECEGVPQFVNKAIFIDLRNSSEFGPIQIPIEIPKIALPDSTRIEITCLGDLLGGTIKNLEKLIRLPYGCGEQNMLNFVPNIVILNYLKNTHQLTVEIEAKAKKFMEIGYQRELSYKHKDGSFSAFGESDKNGSTWLTAFVARSFRQAADHITIQDHIIDESLKWLSENQAADGSFPEKGSICHKEMQGGSSNGLALTAYVLTAFLVNKNTNSAYEETIQKAINNIVESAKTGADLYALAVSAYALELAGHIFTNELISQLKESAKSNDNHKWWEKSIKLESCCWRESKTLNIEITAYALLTLSSKESDSDCLPILKWLLNQRNDQGGFEGTQDTIVGIEALAKFATKITAKENNVKIEMTANSNKYNFNVNKDNALVRQSQKLESDAKSVDIKANGKGFSLLEVAYRYNINIPEKEAAFSLKPNLKLLNEDHFNLEIIVRYMPPKGKDSVKQSNMVVLETALPTGFVLNTELLDGLKKALPLVKRIETKNGETVAVFYLDHLTSDPVSLTVDGFREHIVDEQKPASIVIYDYYDNALSAREFYALEAVNANLDQTIAK